MISVPLQLNKTPDKNEVKDLDTQAQNQHQNQYRFKTRQIENNFNEISKTTILAQKDYTLLKNCIKNT